MTTLKEILEHLVKTEPNSKWTDRKTLMFPSQAIAYCSHLLDRKAFYDGKAIQLIGTRTDEPFHDDLLVRAVGSRIVPYIADPEEHASKDPASDEASRAAERGEEDRFKPAA